MKKLMFTAIALLAFSSASMANSTEKNEPVTNNKAIIIKDCKKIASLMCEFCEELSYEEFGCMDSNEYNSLYDAFYKYCINS
jgi:hypothetical protein